MLDSPSYQSIQSERPLVNLTEIIFIDHFLLTQDLLKNATHENPEIKTY